MTKAFDLNTHVRLSVAPMMDGTGGDKNILKTFRYMPEESKLSQKLFC